MLISTFDVLEKLPFYYTITIINLYNYLTIIYKINKDELHFNENIIKHVH